MSRAAPSANRKAAATAGSGATYPLIQSTTATSSPHTTAVYAASRPASPSHLPSSTSLRRTGRVTMAWSTPESISAETAGEAIADALSATTKLNMNMNRMNAVGSAKLTSPEVIPAPWLSR